LVESRFAMLLADDDRNLVDATEAAGELLGVERELLLTLRVDDVVSRGTDLDLAWDAFLERGGESGIFVARRPGDGGRVECGYHALAHVLPGRHLLVVVRSGPANGPVRLTRREREILALAAGGRTAREIAAHLVLSPTTVETHLRNAARRLEARNRAHAIALALSRGELLELSPDPLS
jgi:DNA-binding CsgD family transcriptional regulator